MRAAVTAPRSLCVQFLGLGQEPHCTLLTDFLLFKTDLSKKQSRKPPGHVPKVAMWRVFAMLPQVLCIWQSLCILLTV